MSDDLEFDPMPDLGTQNDGEPAVVEAEAQAEEVQETAAEPEAQETAAEDEGHEEPKKKSGSQRAREKAARLEAENEALRRLLLQNQPKEEARQVQEDPGKPKAENYNSHEEWVEALADWKTEQKLAQREAQREQERRSREWATKADQARAKYEDFDEALNDAPAPPRHVAAVLNDSPLGAELAYHLATHPDTYRRITSLEPFAAVRELGRLEAGLESPKKPEAPKPQTKAPRPPAPVTAPPAPKPSDDGRLVVY